jgi:hypothetical protein
MPRCPAPTETEYSCGHQRSGRPESFGWQPGGAGAARLGVRPGAHHRHGHHGPGLAAAARNAGLGRRPAAVAARSAAEPSTAERSFADRACANPDPPFAQRAATDPAGADTYASGPDSDAPRGDPDLIPTHVDPAADVQSSTIRCHVAEPVAEPVPESGAIDRRRRPGWLCDEPRCAGGRATSRCIRSAGRAPVADDRRSRVTVRFVRCARADPRCTGDHHPRDPRRAARSRGRMDAGHPALAQPAGLTVDHRIRGPGAAYHRCLCQL